MNKEIEIWQFAAEKLGKGESTVLLAVAESSGSSPGRQGFKMIVALDEMCGSIGGGVMEVSLVKLAQDKSKKAKGKNKFQIVNQVHRKNSLDASGMICSGRQTVIFCRLDVSDLKTIQKIIDALKNKQSKKLVLSNDKLQIAENPTIDFDFEQSGDEFIYTEKLGCKNKLFIIGGGHCALALSELMSKMDFYISLFDDRADLNTLAKNDFVDEKKIIESYENIGEFIEGGNDNFVVVMTLGYEYDKIVIRKLLGKTFKYLGVLGSKAKMKTLLRNLEREGLDKDELSQIRTPVGIEINSRTPFEIAVSIAAEIISVKNSNV